MKEQILNLLAKGLIANTSFNDIKKILGISRQHKDDELRDILNDLQLEGILYEDENNLYSKMPSNFLVEDIQETKKGLKYFELNGDQHYLPTYQLKGAQPYDKVIIEKDNKIFRVKKILRKKYPYIVCEVNIKNGKKELEPINISFDKRITIGTKDMKKLVEGDRLKVKMTTEIFDDQYVGIFDELIGHKNDPDLDFRTIAISCGFNPDFSKEYMEELKNIPDEVTDDDIKNRVDLRNQNIFTIDGKDTRDMDDAVSIQKTNDGYILGVHIAHVTHYIKKDSIIFKEALDRTTSVYFPFSCIPMFHQHISNGICSLNEGKDRLTRTVLIYLDNDANIKDYKIFKSVINSKKKMNYEDVNDVITNHNIKKEYEPFINDLNLMAELSRKLTQKRKEKGYLSFDSNELDFKTNIDNKLESIKGKERIESEMIIENFMILANHIIAFNYSNLPFIYRNHDLPDNQRLKETVMTLQNLGYKIHRIQNFQSAYTLQNILNQLEKNDEYCVLSNMILRSIKKAYYDTENIGHYGLGLDFYTHFTSPARRAPDSLVSYSMDLYDEMNLSSEKLLEHEKFLHDMAEYASMKERMADKAEYYGDKLCLIENLNNCSKEFYEVYIDSINPTYITVRSKDLLDGIIYLEDIKNDNVIYDNKQNCLKSIEDGAIYKIGHKLKVELKCASKENYNIYYTLIENLTLKENPKRIRKIS